ncbi:hypothetical protein [Roseibium sp.]|uniref:hypothetical protein n=1 Tax=Roseibium sp. TaxID=1936156 RepID=UPI003D10747F
MLKFKHAFVVLLFGLAAQAEAQPSFDCAKAVTPDEKTICNNVYLSAADTLISEAYRNYTPEFQQS